MLVTWENFTLRMRTNHRPTASYTEEPVCLGASEVGVESR